VFIWKRRYLNNLNVAKDLIHFAADGMPELDIEETICKPTKNYDCAFVEKRHRTPSVPARVQAESFSRSPFKAALVF